MSVSCFIKLLIGSLLLAAIGYAIGGIAGIASLGTSAILATGLLIGSLIGGVATALYANAVSEPGESTATEEESTSCNIYVGNLPFNVGKDAIKNLFAPFGNVVEIRMVKDRRSRRFKGYAFVEMERTAAMAAIKHLDNTDYAGRTLRVNEAKKKEDD